MATDLLSLVNKCGGTPSRAGMKQFFHAVCCEDVSVMPGFVGTGAGERVTYDGDIVLKQNTAFIKVYIVPYSAELKQSRLGDGRVKRGRKIEYTFQVHTDTEEQVDQAQRLEGFCGVFIIHDNNGARRVLGTKDEPAYIALNDDVVEKDPEGNIFAEFTITAYASGPPPFYQDTAKIDIDPTT